MCLVQTPEQTDDKDKNTTQKKLFIQQNNMLILNHYLYNSIELPVLISLISHLEYSFVSHILMNLFIFVTDVTKLC